MDACCVSSSTFFAQREADDDDDDDAALPSAAQLRWLRAYGRRATEADETPGHPDWAALAARDPQLREFYTRRYRGRRRSVSPAEKNDDEIILKVGVDWRREGARLAATRACLRFDFGLRWDPPPSKKTGDSDANTTNLIPVVPNRLAYLLWIFDLCGKKPAQLTGVDVGTGASCVYPLLGARCFGWRFFATEVDADACRDARRQLDRNAVDIKRRIRLIHTAPEDDDNTTLPLTAALLGRSKDDDPKTLSSSSRDFEFDFSMTNPPFFASHEERLGAAGGSRRPDGLRAEATASEAVFARGGEVGFVTAMIRDRAGRRCRLWNTAMLGRRKSLRQLLAVLRGEHDVVRVETATIDLGRTRRWTLAWTFNPELSSSSEASEASAPSGCFFLDDDDRRKPPYSGSSSSAVFFDFDVAANATAASVADVTRRVDAFLRLASDGDYKGVEEVRDDDDDDDDLSDDDDDDLYDADAKTWRFRATSISRRRPDLDLRLAPSDRDDDDRLTVRVAVAPTTTTDDAAQVAAVFAKLRDAMPGDVARTNRRWRRRLARETTADTKDHASSQPRRGFVAGGGADDDDERR